MISIKNRKGFTIYLSFAVVLAIFFSYYMNSTVEIISIRKLQKKLKVQLLKTDRKIEKPVTVSPGGINAEQDYLNR